MTMMARVAILLVLTLAVSPAAEQELGLLHIKVVLLDATMKPTPVPQHALLISDNPATSAPRRVLTGGDGAADLRLRPGNYTVESDQPVAFRGKTYQWAETVDIAAGRDTTLNLTADNAEIGAVTGGAPTSAEPLAADPSFLLPEWQASVVSVWTPTAHASGFIADANGLVATSGLAVGSATSVQVQLTRAVKVAASVLASDIASDLAILRIDREIAAPLRPLPLGCGQPRAPLAAGQAIFAIGARPLQPNDLTSGTVSTVTTRAIASNLLVPEGSEGGPVFGADGVVVGVSSGAAQSDSRGRGNSRVVPIEAACAALAAAAKKVEGAAAPGGAHLPVEPTRPFPIDVLKNDLQRRAVGLTGYQLSTSDFDITFITPPLLYAAHNRVDQAVHRERSGGAAAGGTNYGVPRQLTDFGNWSDYVADLPPAVLVRATPRLVEGFWTKVARGAAMTQGMSLPAITHFTSGFSRMRLLCGEHEVTPIQPFRLEARVSDTETIAEGLYVFDPDALAPSCAGVKLVLYSNKQPEKADTRVVDPAIVQRVWNDFAPYRSTQ
jgi:S1-C subfamily serine protease